MGWRFVLSLIFSIIVALFAIANAAAVRVNFIIAVYEVSQALVILISAMAGALIVLLLSVVRSIKTNMKISNQEKVIEELQNKNEATLEQFALLEKKYEELFVERDCPEKESERIPELQISDSEGSVDL